MQQALGFVDVPGEFDSRRLHQSSGYLDQVSADAATTLPRSIAWLVRWTLRGFLCLVDFLFDVRENLAVTVAAPGVQPSRPRSRFVRKLKLGSVHVGLRGDATVHIESGDLFSDHLIELRLGTRANLREALIA